MKKIMFILMLFPSVVMGRPICININDRDIRITEDIVIDFEDWIIRAVQGKISKAKSRLIQNEIQQSLKEGSPIPSTEDAIIDKRFNRPDYKSQRELAAEQESELLNSN